MLPGKDCVSERKDSFKDSRLVALQGYPNYQDGALCGEEQHKSLPVLSVKRTLLVGWQATVVKEKV